MWMVYGRERVQYLKYTWGNLETRLQTSFRSDEEEKEEDAIDNEKGELRSNNKP